jgi:hypothetical protein
MDSGRGVRNSNLTKIFEKKEKKTQVMKLESVIPSSTFRDKTYLDIKKPRVKSPISDDFDDIEIEDMDVDEHTQIDIKKPKLKNRGQTDFKKLEVSQQITENNVLTKFIDL